MRGLTFQTPLDTIKAKLKKTGLDPRSMMFSHCRKSFNRNIA